MSKFKSLVVGEVLSETQYYKVEKIAGNRAQFLTDNGDRVVLDESYVNNLLASAQQFEKTEKVTKTALAEIFMKNARVAMTVQFNKQVKPEDVSKGIVALYDKMGIGMTKADFTKQVKKALNLKGEERVMVGRHYGTTDVNGRVHFIDMNVDKAAGKDYDTRQRLVDPRTLNYIIVNNVKYQVK